MRNSNHVEDGILSATLGPKKWKLRKGSNMTGRPFLKQWLVPVGLALVAPTIVLSQEVAVSQEFVRLESKGAAVLDNGPTTPPPTVVNPRLEIRKQSLDGLTHLPRIGAARLATPLTFPNVKNNELATSNTKVFGFDGLDHRDQRLAGTGAFVNTQFSLEPRPGLLS